MTKLTNLEMGKPQSFLCSLITTIDVKDAICNLKNSNSIDNYGLNRKIIKHASELILIPRFYQLLKIEFLFGFWPGRSTAAAVSGGQFCREI